ncbi:MAG: hypothetical protein KDA28_17170, partial [Phycisphaerales bacterium]|nr:hypothetical protein [Phycisphaerales bacterium]
MHTSIRPVRSTGRLALLASLLLAGCASDVTMREDAPERSLREMASRFDAMPMPTPTDVRLATGEPGPAYWQNECDYVIDATLDAEARTVEATGRVTYTNHSPYAL